MPPIKEETKQETKTIKMFSNAEILAHNSIGKVIDNDNDNFKLSVPEHQLCQQVVFETLRQLDENDLLKCTLKDLFE